jgi:hypothetical protein
MLVLQDRAQVNLETPEQPALNRCEALNHIWKLRHHSNQQRILCVRLLLYQGQICMSTERLVVDEAVADEFVAKFDGRAVIDEFTELKSITIEPSVQQ